MNTTNGFAASSLAVAAIMPPLPVGTYDKKDQRSRSSTQSLISCCSSRGQQDWDWDPTTAAAIAVGGWIYGEYNSSTSGSKKVVCSMDDSKTSSVTVDNDRESPQKKRKVIPLLKSLLLTSFIREGLLAPVNRQCADNTTEPSSQSAAAASMLDHCLVHPSWMDSRGVQW